MSTRRLLACCGFAVSIVSHASPAVQQSSSAEALGGRLRLEVTLAPATTWVQSTMRYRLRFWQAVSFGEIDITPPVVDLAEVRQVGEERVMEMMAEGRRFRVTERDYAITPVASGERRVAGARVSGRVPAAQGETEVLTLVASSIGALVRPMPPTVDPSSWLPAAQVLLERDWLDDPAAAEVGAGRRFRLSVRATGVSSAQIPALRIEGTEGLSLIRTSARTEDRWDGQANQALREEVWQALPTAPGPRVVPGVTLAWFDAATGRQTASSLGPLIIDVRRSTTSSQGLAGESDTGNDHARSRALRSRWQPVALALAVAGAILVLLGRRSIVRMLQRQAAWCQVRVACRSGAGPRQAGRLLMTWAALRYSERPPRNLQELAARTGSAAPARLDRACYGVGDWDGFAEWPALRQMARLSGSVPSTK